MGGAKNPKLKEGVGNRKGGKPQGTRTIYFCVGQMENSVVVCIKKTSRGDGGGVKLKRF